MPKRLLSVWRSRSPSSDERCDAANRLQDGLRPVSRAEAVDESRRDLRSPAPRKGAVASFVILIIFLFSGLRGAFLAVREPFFDDLFTVWIARMPFREMMDALRLDSGPPLYYLLVRLAVPLREGAAAIELVERVRFFSFAIGFATLLVVLGARHLGNTRYVAALLFACFPPAMLFATEARAYALCGLLAGLCAILLHRWSETGRTVLLGFAVLFAVLAAWSHYYGVVLLPLPLVAGLFGQGRKLIGRGVAAAISGSLLFIPGLMLALAQPRDAVRWMTVESRDAPAILLSALRQLGFAASYPAALLEPMPAAAQLVSAAVIGLLFIFGVRRSTTARFFFAMTLAPVLFIAMIGLFREAAYFPLRFESVLSVPFTIAVGASLLALTPKLRIAATMTLLVLALLVTYASLMSAVRGSRDPFREAAFATRSGLGTDAFILASGFSYLETISQAGDRWSPQIFAFPAEQARHPGWSRPADAETLESELETLLPRLPPHFAWVGARNSVELKTLTRRCASRPVHGTGPALIAILSCDPVPMRKDGEKLKQ